MSNRSRVVAGEEAAGTAAPLGSETPMEIEGIVLELRGAPAVRFRLLWQEAPETCAAVSSSLPDRAECFHAIYSGTIAAFLLEPTVVASVENATTCVVPGDLLFTHYESGVRHGHANALSEIYWPYDRYARPTVPGQFVPLAASVFGTYDGDPQSWTVFAQRCRELRFSGKAMLGIRRY